MRVNDDFEVFYEIEEKELNGTLSFLADIEVMASEIFGLVNNFVSGDDFEKMVSRVKSKAVAIINAQSLARDNMPAPLPF